MLMNMGVPPEDPTTEVKNIEGQLKGIRDVLWASLVMSQVHGAQSSDGDHDEDGFSFSWAEILVLAAIYVFIAWTSIWCWEGLKTLRRFWKSRSQEVQGVDDLHENVSGLARKGRMTSMRARGARSQASFRSDSTKEISAGAEARGQGDHGGAVPAVPDDGHPRGALQPAGDVRDPGLHQPLMETVTVLEFVMLLKFDATPEDLKMR